MEELIYYTSLFDYYGILLTTTQQKYFKEYYFNNLSLQEIADNYQISKNAVSKVVKEVKEKLDYYEKSLHLYHNKNKIEEILNEDTLKSIEKYI
jgi:hypothetical protein